MRLRLNSGGSLEVIARYSGYTDIEYLMAPKIESGDTLWATYSVSQGAAAGNTRWITLRKGIQSGSLFSCQHHLFSLAYTGDDNDDNEIEGPEERINTNSVAFDNGRVFYATSSSSGGIYQAYGYTENPEKPEFPIPFSSPGKKCPKAK